jgi:tetratricopeptide (TPR) repeat protein
MLIKMIRKGAVILLLLALQIADVISHEISPASFADGLQGGDNQERGFATKASGHAVRLPEPQQDGMLEEREDPLQSNMGDELPGSRATGFQNPNDTLQRALQHLIAGNDFSVQGKHTDAIKEWKKATYYKPDSNVPWNNMANAYMAIGDQDAARKAAEQAVNHGLDYMSSTTLANVYRAMNMYEEAEDVLIKGCEHTERQGEKFEHPFWSLANLYWDQGDYIEFVRYGMRGLDLLSHDLCTGPDPSR